MTLTYKQMCDLLKNPLTEEANRWVFELESSNFSNMFTQVQW